MFFTRKNHVCTLFSLFIFLLNNLEKLEAQYNMTSSVNCACPMNSSMSTSTPVSLNSTLTNSMQLDCNCTSSTFIPPTSTSTANPYSTGQGQGQGGAVTTTKPITLSSMPQVTPTRLMLTSGQGSSSTNPSSSLISSLPSNPTNPPQVVVTRAPILSLSPEVQMVFKQFFPSLSAATISLLAANQSVIIFRILFYSKLINFMKMFVFFLI